MDNMKSDFASVESAVSHYQSICSSLQRQVEAANQDMDDYTESTKELQLELETELDRMDKSEREMRRALEGAENEKDEWKAKYTASLREHTTTMTHMQRELESLRTSEKALRNKLRDMELDNDDLEKSEREKDSSLQDLENRYGKSIERIALLEEELVTKAQLEEEVQRLKDELRDLHEEVAVMKTQVATAYSAPPSRSITPSHQPSASIASSSDRPLSASPPSSSHDSSFDTPRQRGSPVSTASSTPPSFPITKPPPAARSLTSPSPIPSRASSSASSSQAQARIRVMSSAKPFTPPPGMPKSPSTFGRPLGQTPAQLARSTRGVNLASQTATGMTPKSVRERRADGMIRDMKEMTDRVKQLTSRLDSRRNLVMAGSAIPRASMSPGGPGLQRSMTARRLTGLMPSNLSFASGAGHARRDSKGLTVAGQEEEGAMRPPSRSALRRSVGGTRQSTIPVRPHSRQSNHTNSLSVSSRPATPSLPPSRSPTPSAGSNSSGSRPSWNAPPNARASLATSTNRPRAGSAALASSTYGAVGRGVPSATPGRASAELGQSQSRVPRPASREGHYAGLGRPNVPPMPSPATQAAALRRTSMNIPVRPGSALGKSLRRPSGAGAV